MTDFPRGWTLVAAPAGGVLGTVTAPAITGVTHVLDGFYARVVQEAAGALAGAFLQLTTSDGAFTNFDLAFLVQTGTVGGIDSDSDSGLNLAGGPGASMTVAFSAALADSQEFARILGHDI